MTYLAHRITIRDTRRTTPRGHAGGMVYARIRGKHFNGDTFTVDTNSPWQNLLYACRTVKKATEERAQ